MTMNNMKDAATIRQQSSDNNSVSSSEWDMANDVFVSGYDDTPMGDGVAAGDLVGDLAEDLVGDHAGDLAGDLVGDLVGDLAGDHAGDRDLQQPGLDRHLPLLSPDGMMLGLAGDEYSGSSYLDIDPNYTESDGNVTTKKRIRSNSSRHRGEIVTELGPEEVRWFYKEDKRTWKPFVGHDSLKIETVYRRFSEQNPDKVKRPVDPSDAARSGDMQPDSGAADGGQEEIRDPVPVPDVEAVCVRGGLYEVDIREKECYPVYWNREHPNDFIRIE